MHLLSPRRDQPFVRVNCAALSETILESELFGHIKGAFTGAHRDRIGRFEAADGGTILLDEVGELSERTQAKLLRVLQERAFERVGETETRAVDVRVLAATNVDLAARVRDGRFRDDLFYRLNVFPIHMPALREHREDIPLLVQHFTDSLNESTGKQIAALDTDAMHAVMDYCWPGNVRELLNALQYAFVTCQDETIGLFDLPEPLRRTELRAAACRPATATHAVTPRMRRKPNREQLLALLEECGWNKAEVGRRLGISRTAVWKWMRKYAIPLQPDA